MNNKEVISKTTKEIFLQELLNLGYTHIHYTSIGQVAIADNENLDDSKKDITMTFFGNSDIFNFIPEGINEVKDIRHELGIIDWLTVPIDTSVNVWNKDSTEKERRHFAGFKAGKILTWTNGRTFFSNYKYATESWDYAELADK